MKKTFDNYYLGFDIGTESVGWAVTDEEYNVLKFNGKAMWGVRSFDEAKPAAERRVFRATRRRLQRRRQRVELLQEIFDSEISKVDNGFYQRLNDSKFYPEDKKGSHSKNIFFSDINFSDKDYYKKYPTIYHLRNALIKENTKFDIRLIYLALHHIIKYRGHFLIYGDLENLTFEKVFCEYKESLLNGFDITLDCDSKELENLLKKDISKTDKKNELKKLFKTEKNKIFIAAAELLAGSSVAITDAIDEYEGDKISLCLSSSDFDVKREEASILGDDLCRVIDAAKALYDWSLLARILDGKTYISEAKIEVFKKHKADLKLLKSFIKVHAPDKFESIFSSKEGLYAAYAGHKNSVKRKGRDGDQGFYKALKNIVSKCSDSPQKTNILKEIENETFLPLQTNSDNGVIPHQVHFNELKAILDNAEKYYPFLKEKDEFGYTAREKIEKIFKFRIPYYVGPLNDSHKDKGANCWIVRKDAGAIRAWNFKEKVDEEASAENFIRRMTSKCTYLIGKDVLPKSSLLYQKYMVLNELNNLKINGKNISVDTKQKIFNDLFKEKSKVTGKTIITYYKTEFGITINADNISGIDKDFKSSLSTYLDFKKKVFKGEEHRIDEYSTQQAIEDIVKWITIYGDDKGFLKRKIQSEYNDMFSADQIKTICSFKYSSWGNFSKELLTEVQGADKETGEVYTIIDALMNTNENFMQLLSYRYSFNEEITKYNEEQQEDISSISYDSLLKDAYLSPATKRAVWQTITIAEEIKNITKKLPNKIFIEMARGDKNTKKGDAGRTKTRQNTLLELYKNIKSNEFKDLENEIKGKSNNELQNKRLYLYFIQLGKCMYSGEKIELDDLYNNNIYDIDHIYPQSKIKDDSFDNIVLVKKTANARKSDDIISDNIRIKMNGFWHSLKEKGLLSKEKLSRLTRTSTFTDDELAGFINRQLVETRQSTKATANIFKKIYPETTVVYVKASNVSDFRREYDFVKCRSVNDFHHAKDAYLNIVVGNAYNTKFTDNPAKWFKKHKESGTNPYYNLKYMYDKDIGENGSAWKAGETGTIETVRKFMAKNNVLYTRYAYINKGQFFDQNIVSDNPSVPIKKGIDLKYGGYKGVTPAYFCLIKCKDKKGNELRRIEAVPIYLQNKFEKDKNALIEYCKNTLGLIDPVIKIPCIKKNALIAINNFPMHLKGTNEDKILLQVGIQFHLKDEFISIVKKIDNYFEKLKDNQKYIINEKYDGISKENNIKLFKELIIRSRNNLYKNRPASQSETLLKGLEKFENLELKDQCKVISETLKLFACKPLNADLSLIGGSKFAGNVGFTKNTLIKNKSIILINQSSTGLFEESIDLLKI
ncbi:MAG: type II CRISPR RNA-guided endonuclease Cas9 [Deferribacterales bacterium]|nr:type II CRISPR RNA-guided endonuclease Cas9 [Deferribacterales bacterium]